MAAAPGSRPTRSPSWDERLRRHFSCDRASATMVAYVIAAAVFVIGTSFLLNFAVQPHTSSVSNLEHANLKTKANQALDVLMGSPGIPSDWSSSSSAVEGLERLGLIQSGYQSRLDPTKFEAIARGSFVVNDSGNGFVDYEEARAALGLQGYDFHLRVYPLYDFKEHGPYGTGRMGDYRVAYIGDFDGSLTTPNANSQKEIDAINQLGLAFNPAVRNSLTGTGDVYRDASSALRANLVPQLGNEIVQSVISAGSGTKYDFTRVNASTFNQHFTTDQTGRAMALATPSGELGYTKNRELRAIVGAANLSGLAYASSLDTVYLKWNEWVDTDRGTLARDAGDYGYVALSADGGQTWHALTNDAFQRSQDTPSMPQTPADGWRARTVGITPSNCPNCYGSSEVLVAFHWVADNDNNIGYGWIVDDVKVEKELLNPLLHRTFESPEYGMLIIGSNVDSSAFTPQEVKDAIKSYVSVQGGRLVVLGGDASTTWLQPIFQVGSRASSPGVGAPDPTHPMLTVPNELDWADYQSTNAWRFNGDEASLFNAVIVGASPSDHLLTVSKGGAFGNGSVEGSVMLTSYMPYSMDSEQAARFFANSVMYGKYRYLYMEVGPEVPTSVPVATAMRTATMDGSMNGTPEHFELAMVMYLWGGAGGTTTAATNTMTKLAPSAPRDVTATAGDAQVALSWTRPSSLGTAPLLDSYVVRRGTSPLDVTAVVAEVPATLASTYAWTNTGLVNGVTYYYNVTAKSADGTSVPSPVVSATPIGKAGPPVNLSTLGLVGQINLNWTAPPQTGGGTITGYRVWESADGTTFTVAAELGSTLRYVRYTSGTSTLYFKVQALNAYGWGDESVTVSGAAVAGAAPVESLVASPNTNDSISLTWLPPSDLGGGTLLGYRVWGWQGSNNAALLADIADPLAAGWTHYNLGASQMWNYNVQAVTDAGPGANATASATTHNVPGAPASLSASHVAGVGNALSWTAPLSDGGSPVTSYNVYRWDGSTRTLLQSTALLSWTHAPGVVGDQYRVHAVNGIGESTAWAEATAS